VNRPVVLAAAALLLQYPDERTRAGYGPVRSALAGRRGRAAAELLSTVDALAAMPPRALEEHYVATLDRQRRCCLFLTWWTDGETRRRGLALARLKEVYRANGHELVAAELPDFLPVMLEFAAAEPDVGLALLQEHRPGLELLRLALEECGTPYAGVLRAVCSLLPGPSPRDEAAARALARTGPPVEQVGLAGYGVSAADPALPEGARR
jgi:nitrate reductase delta subunit